MKRFLLLVFCILHWSSQIFAAQTQINEVTDLFDRHIENKEVLVQDLKGQTGNAIGQIKSRSHHESIEGINGAEGKVRELNSIGEKDLDNAGRQKRASAEYQFYDDNELEPDYGKAGNIAHKIDATDIVNATGKKLKSIGIDIMERLKVIGFNCKTVKGSIQKDPVHYIEVKKEERKNTIYDQVFCEESRNTYSCKDALEVKCLLLEKEWLSWEQRTIEFTGREVMDRKWHLITKPEAKYFLAIMNNEPYIKAQVRAEIARRTGASIEQIDTELNISVYGPKEAINAGGKQYIFETHPVHYRFRTSKPVCRQWQEIWTETCILN